MNKKDEQYVLVINIFGTIIILLQSTHHNTIIKYILESNKS